MTGGGTAGVGGTAYVCEGAAYTAPEAASGTAGAFAASEAPINAL